MSDRNRSTPDDNDDGDITLVRYCCAQCQSELMIVNKPANQAPGPVTVYIPGTMVLSCRVCRERTAAEMRLLAWPSDSKLAN